MVHITYYTTEEPSHLFQIYVLHQKPVQLLQDVFRLISQIIWKCFVMMAEGEIIGNPVLYHNIIPPTSPSTAHTLNLFSVGLPNPPEIGGLGCNAHGGRRGGGSFISKAEVLVQMG